MRCALLGLTLGVVAVMGMPCLAAGQGGSAKSTLTGTVVDEGGAVLPGATVIVKNASTGVETHVVTNSTGAFDVPVLDAHAAGALLMHFMLETIVAGRLLGLDPFDQPAVELAKILTRRRLGG